MRKVENVQPPEGDLDDVGLLNDAVRRRVYGFLVQKGKVPVTREEVASAVGITRKLAAYHLDKLAEAELLDVDYARANGRSGPGAGRPAKRYAWNEREVSVSIPPRSYDLLARILATAVDQSPTGAVGEMIEATATAQGVEVGRNSHSVEQALTVSGYEPRKIEHEVTILRNCPFHSIVEDHTQLVCSLNCAFIRGALSGLNDDPDRAELNPEQGRCCVVIGPSTERTAV